MKSPSKLIILEDLCIPTGGLLDTSYKYDTKLVGIVIGGIVFFTTGFGLTYSHLAWYQSEFLALEVRSVGSGIATTANWVANLVVSVSYLTELETLTPSGTYGLYLGFSVVFFIFAVFCYPETSKFPLIKNFLRHNADNSQ